MPTNFKGTPREHGATGQVWGKVSPADNDSDWIDGSTPITRDNRFVIEGSPGNPINTPPYMHWGDIVLDGPDFTWDIGTPDELVVVNDGMYLFAPTISLEHTVAAATDRCLVKANCPQRLGDPSNGFWQSYQDTACIVGFQQVWTSQGAWLDAGAIVKVIVTSTGTGTVDYGFMTVLRIL